MGKQSARLFYQGKDHKDIFFDRKYHDKMYIGAQLVWEKLNRSWDMFETDYSGNCCGNGMFLSTALRTSNDGYNWDESKAPSTYHAGRASIFFKGNFYIFSIFEFSSYVDHIKIYKTRDLVDFEQVITVYQEESGNYASGAGVFTGCIPFANSYFSIYSNDKEVIIVENSVSTSLYGGQIIYYSTDCINWERRGCVRGLSTSGRAFFAKAIINVTRRESYVSYNMFYFDGYWYFPGYVYDVYPDSSTIGYAKVEKTAKFWRTKTFIYSDIEETELNGESVISVDDIALTNYGLIKYKGLYSINMKNWYENYHNIFDLSEINGKKIISSSITMGTLELDRCGIRNKMYHINLTTDDSQETDCIIFCKSSPMDNEVEQLKAPPYDRMTGAYVNGMLKSDNKYFVWAVFQHNGIVTKKFVYIREEE